MTEQQPPDLPDNVHWIRPNVPVAGHLRAEPEEPRRWTITFEETRRERYDTDLNDRANVFMATQDGLTINGTSGGTGLTLGDDEMVADQSYHVTGTLTAVLQASMRLQEWLGEQTGDPERGIGLNPDDDDE